MVASCVAYGCKNLHKAKEPLTFHSFPFKRPEILELWVKAIKRENWRPTKASRICGDHFLKTDFFCVPNTKRILLKSDAVPSIFNVSASQTRKCKKRARDSATEEATKNIDDNKKLKGEPGQDLILLNELHEEALDELLRQDNIEEPQEQHNNDIYKQEICDDIEVVIECSCVHEDPGSPPEAQIDSGTEEAMDKNLVFGLPSTSTNESTLLSTNASKTFADVAVSTTENYNTVEKLRRQVKQLQQVIRRKDVKIACLEEVIKELCETAYDENS